LSWRLDVLPFSKKIPQVSDSDVVYTGEIEVVRESPARSTRPQAVRQHAAYPVPAARKTPVPPPRQTHDSSTNIAISRPRTRRGVVEPVLDDRSELFCVPGQGRSEERHSTIVPPAALSYPTPYPEELSDLAETDDEMTRLMAHRPKTAMALSSRRPAPWSVTPAHVSTPLPPSRSPDARLATTMPSERQSPRSATSSGPRAAVVERAPDSLRPVAFPADLSGRHEPQPTSITLRTHILTGRPTMTWATALVVLGVFVGLSTSLYGRGDQVASSVSSWLAPQNAAAAAQPQAESPAPQALQYVARAAVAAPVSAAPPAQAVTVADRAASAEAPNDPLAALMDTKGRDSTSHVSTQRPTYVAPGDKGERAPSAAPVHHWVAPAKPVAAASPFAAPPVALAAAAAPALTVAALDPAPPPPAAAPAPRSTKGSKSKKGAADADLQAASASDALARAQLEAALR
jgi:hypothetical protein